LETVDALEAFDLQLIAGAHCTGWRALGQLAQRFGDRVVASAVGKRFML
jgi:7,8-dihydropterin-6-yl-methyl-4-(beta-D-ribofuranosyl)aminobenzene 5'-phosphate synthase